MFTTAGTPTYDTVVVPEGQTVWREYELLAGVSVHVAAAVENDRHYGDVHLIAGRVSPRTWSELQRVLEQTDKTRRRSPNAYVNNGRRFTTELTDVTPGLYTVCVTESLHSGGGRAGQPVVTRDIVVGGEPVFVEVVLPPRGA